MKQKETYVSPKCEMLELCPEKVIATSAAAPLLYPTFNDPFNFGGSETYWS